MRKITALLLSTIILFSFTACKGEEAENTTTKPQTTIEEKSTESSKEDVKATEDVNEKETEASSKETNTTETTKKATKVTTTKKSSQITTTVKPVTTTKKVTTTTTKAASITDKCKLADNVPCTFTNGGSSIKVTDVFAVTFDVNPNNPNQVRVRFGIKADVISNEGDPLAVTITVTNSLGQEVFKRSNYFAAGSSTESWTNSKNEATSYADVGNGTFTLTVTQG